MNTSVSAQFAHFNQPNIMNLEDVKPGNRPKVKIAKVLRASISKVLPPGFTKCRKPGTNGTVINAITGHGGELFFIEHDDKTFATYHHTEFDLHGQTS